jgi:sporulation protein YlmC with PRC-barrel domain
MDQSKGMSLVGMKIIGQHGREVGVISDMFADVETWHLQSLEVKLNRETLDDLRLKRPWFGTQTVHVPVSEISGATDNLVLKHPLEEMEFSGGKPAEAASPIAEAAPEGKNTLDDRSESTH